MGNEQYQKNAATKPQRAQRLFTKDTKLKIIFNYKC